MGEIKNNEERYLEDLELRRNEDNKAVHKKRGWQVLKLDNAQDN